MSFTTNQWIVGSLVVALLGIFIIVPLVSPPPADTFSEVDGVNNTERTMLVTTVSYTDFDSNDSVLYNMSYEKRAMYNSTDGIWVDEEGRTIDSSVVGSWEGDKLHTYVSKTREKEDTVVYVVPVTDESKDVVRNNIDWYAIESGFQEQAELESQGELRFYVQEGSISKVKAELVFSHPEE